ncbi:MAG: relaxase [Aquamicrobium sp.]|nr:relaxase [Aquamicrobium sp.]
MILVASQRGGGRNLADHLMNVRDNDHVAVEQMRGFVGGSLREAFDEAHAISKATRAKQYLFSLSLSPPRDAEVTVDEFLAAIDRAEAAVGLTGQPRVVVIHEKEGRRHAHTVWSRIDGEKLKAINLPFFQERLSNLSRELYLEHGWELPPGHRTNGWKSPLNFTLEEWQQAKKLGLDPREIKQAFQEAWRTSDNLPSFRHALEERGFFLAKGDRRGFVAVDLEGRTFAIARWTGLKTKEVETRLGRPDALPGVDAVTKEIKRRLRDDLGKKFRESRQQQEQERAPLHPERTALVTRHRAERSRLLARQEERWREEARARALRLRGGLRGVLDILTGRARLVRQQNEREALDAIRRDRDQREQLVRAQASERRALQDRIETLAARQREERRLTARQIAALIKQSDPPLSPHPNTVRPARRRPDRGHSFSR